MTHSRHRRRHAWDICWHGVKFCSECGRITGDVGFHDTGSGGPAPEWDVTVGTTPNIVASRRLSRCNAQTVLRVGMLICVFFGMQIVCSQIFASRHWCSIPHSLLANFRMPNLSRKHDFLMIPYIRYRLVGTCCKPPISSPWVPHRFCEDASFGCTKSVPRCSANITTR